MNGPTTRSDDHGDDMPLGSQGGRSPRRGTRSWSRRRRSIGLATLVLIAFARCGGGGGGGGGGPAAPATVSFATNPVSFRAGVAATPDLASTTGGAPTTFSVSPPLPTGLSLDPVTGVVSGTPGSP